MLTQFFPYGLLIVLVATALFLLILLLKSVYMVRQAEAIVIERLGKYDRVLTPGMHIVVPFRATAYGTLELCNGS